MPQHTTFPYLPSGKPSKAIDALIGLCREMAAEGVPFKELRSMLRARDLWKKERLDETLRFFRMSRGDVIVPSEVMRAVAEAEGQDAAREVLTERLWEVNPLLFKAMIERLSERPYTLDELVSFVGSYGYRGEPVHRSQIEAWLWLAQGLGVAKRVGIAFALDRRGAAREVEARQLDVDEFLEEDEPEELPAPIERTGSTEALAEAPEVEPAAATPAPAPAAASAAVEAAVLGAGEASSPLGRQRPVALSRFAGQRVFPEGVLSETSACIESWWKEQEHAADGPSADDFGLDGERWMEGSEQVLYRLAVAAALAFRLGKAPGEVKRAFGALDSAGVLDDLYYGTAPDSLPERVDPKALMLASLVARRCAESPELAVELEKQKSAADAFAALDKALGRGLFKLELFWMMRRLGELGVLRFDDLPDFAALPHRIVRDTLFRMGYIDTPYAHDLGALVSAAAAARGACGDVAAPDQVLATFSVAAGCAYGCPLARTCDYACRERADL